MKKHLRKIITALEAIGCRVRADTSRRHYRLELVHGDRSGVITVSGTPQNDDDAVNLAVQDARRELGLFCSPKAAGSPRRRRHRRVAPKTAVPIPAPVAAVQPDGRAVLTEHPLYGAVLERRLQAAFAGLWSDTCMQLFGSPSVLSTVTRRFPRDW